MGRVRDRLGFEGPVGGECLFGLISAVFLDGFAAGLAQVGFVVFYRYLLFFSMSVRVRSIAVATVAEAV